MFYRSFNYWFYPFTEQVTTIITVHTFYKTIVTGLFIQFVEFIYNPVYIEYKYSVTSDRTSPELNHHWRRGGLTYLSR